MMRILVLLCCIWLARAEDLTGSSFYENISTTNKPCSEDDGVTFDGKYYDKELLVTIGRPKHFSYSKTTNTLFFSYLYYKQLLNDVRLCLNTSTIPNLGTIDDSGIAYYNIDTKELKNVPGLKQGIATAINTETDEVYLATNEEIKKFNPQTKELTHVLYYTKIHSIFFEKLLFFVDTSSGMTYRYNGHEFVNLNESLRYVNTMMGEMGEYYYSSVKGLYRVLNDKQTEKFAEHHYELAKDNNKKIFAASHDAVFVPNIQDKKLDKVADIKGILSFTFDKDNNIYYSDLHHIYKLKPSKANLP